MENNTVKLLGNSGVFINFEGTKIIYDGLHQDFTHRFSPMGKEAINYIMKEDADIVIFSHLHPDHFSKNIAEKYLAVHPSSTLIMPYESITHAGKTVFLQEKEYNFTEKGIDIHAMRLTHEGEKYVNYPNYGFVLSKSGKTLLFLGDGGMLESETKNFIRGTKINTVFLNFPFVCILKGRKIASEIIKPEKIFAFHIPYPKDDKEGYIPMLHSCVERNKNSMPSTVILENELQEEELF